MGVRAFLDGLSLRPDDAGRYELALAEAVNNVVAHARCSDRDWIDVTLVNDGDTLRIAISDNGSATDLDRLNTLMSRREPPGDLDTSGGVFVIRQVMDHVTYARKNDRNVLTMLARMKRCPV